MEGLLRLSKLKLRLLALISDSKHLRESERGAREELRFSVQRRREAEGEFSTKLQELQAELASRDELQRKLETRLLHPEIGRILVGALGGAKTESMRNQPLSIKYLENDNILLEKKQKELKDTLDRVLKSRDSFMNIYEDSTCVLKNAIQIRDRKLSIFSDKIQRHLSLFDSIVKEAEAVKQTVDSVQGIVSEKEHIVTRLKEKMDKLSTFEKELVEKICSMESKLSNYQHELQRKDTSLLELKEQLEAAKNNISLQSQVEEFQRTLLIKEEIIENLMSEKKGLHLEFLSMELMFRKIQDNVVMCAELDQHTKSLPLEEGQMVTMASVEENGRLGKMRKVLGEDSPSRTREITVVENPVSVVYQKDSSAIDTTSDRNIDNSCTSELFAHFSPRSVCSGPPSMANIINASTDEKRLSCAPAMHYLDSESSTTETEAPADEPA